MHAAQRATPHDMTAVPRRDGMHARTQTALHHTIQGTAAVAQSVLQARVSVRHTHAQEIVCPQPALLLQPVSSPPRCMLCQRKQASHTPTGTARAEPGSALGHTASPHTGQQQPHAAAASPATYLSLSTPCSSLACCGSS
jgi:hypothetical protein